MRRRVAMFAAFSSTLLGCGRGSSTVVSAYAIAFQEPDPDVAAARIAAAVSTDYDCLGLDRDQYLAAFADRAGTAYQASTSVTSSRSGRDLEIEIRRTTAIPADESGLPFSAEVESLERRRLELANDGRVRCDRTLSRRIESTGSLAGNPSPRLPTLEVPVAVAAGSEFVAHAGFPAPHHGLSSATAIVHVDWVSGEYPSGWQDSEEQHLLGSVASADVTVVLPGPMEPGQDSATVAASWVVRSGKSPASPLVSFSSLAFDILYEEEL